MKTTGRNDPCPCSSGKKYKQCCLAAGVGAPPAARSGSVDEHRALQAATACREAGQLQAAANVCRQVLLANPVQADALHLLGLVAFELGDTTFAVDCLMRATRARPAFAEAHYHLGLLCMHQGLLDEAVVQYGKAVEVAPLFLEAHANRGVVLNRMGLPLEALGSFLSALSIREAVEVKIGVAECLQRLRLGPSDSHLRPVLTRAIAEAWRRPEELAPAACAMILSDPAMQAAVRHEGPTDIQTVSARRDDALLLRLLETATVCDVALEQWLTQARAVLLAEVLAPSTTLNDLLELQGALARQCFINDYAWWLGASEGEQLARLQARIDDTLEAGGIPPAEDLLALASYQPLHDVPHVDTLLHHPWPEAVRPVLQQQVEEPRLEARLRDALPRLTEIDGLSSSKVQQQYEVHPYPRWSRSSLFPSPMPLDDRLRAQIPHARFRSLGMRDGLDILIAGCGTGRHSTETTAHYRGARVLAIDLSARSLGYAARKSQALGQAGIEYAQADILRLASLERRFDLIESVGVLHHLAEPEAGWRALLPLLRPGGLMLIGLYSALAREPVVAARNFIAERGYPSTAEGIRDCRQALMACDCPQALRKLTRFGDFFGLNACRDLLFHEQEHRTTLLEIQALLDRLQLQFVGLHVEPPVLRGFRARFPEPDAVHDLGCWHRYEMEHPDTFVGMYQFWVQKASA